MNQSTPSGEVGVILEDVEGRIVVRRVFARSSAARAGIQKGDILRRVEATTPANATEALLRFKGAPSSLVAVEVERGPENRKLILFRAR
jgi:C-terminal processing protease CtpA/Prc